MRSIVILIGVFLMPALSMAQASEKLFGFSILAGPQLVSVATKNDRYDYRTIIYREPATSLSFRMAFKGNAKFEPLVGIRFTQRSGIGQMAGGGFGGGSARRGDFTLSRGELQLLATTALFKSGRFSLLYGLFLGGLLNCTGNTQVWVYEVDFNATHPTWGYMNRYHSGAMMELIMQLPFKKPGWQLGVYAQLETPEGFGINMIGRMAGLNLGYGFTRERKTKH